MKKKITCIFFGAKKLAALFFSVFALCLLNISSFGQTVVTNPTSPWMVPAGVTSITVYCWGGGGGGGGATSGGTGSAGGGGGGGGISTAVVAVTAGQSCTIVVGAGGTAGAAGNHAGVTGGTSSFAIGATTYCSAIGGTGGNGSPASTSGTLGGAGGTSGIGYLYMGGTGAVGGVNSNGGFGGGGGGGAGSSSAGSNGAAGTFVAGGGSNGGPGGTGTYPGGAGAKGTYTTADLVGVAGTAPGGGGSGGESITTSKGGGVGGAGQVVIIYTAVTTPTITSFTPNPICTGSTLTVTGTNFTSGGTITFTGASAIAYTYVSATSITAIVPAAATTGNFTVTTAGGTATSPSSLTVNTSPAAPTFSTTATSPVCPGVVESYAVTNTGLTYAWSVTGTGWTPTTGSGATFAPTSGTANGTISVTASNGTCTSSAATTTTTVIQPPTQPTSITPATAVCAGSTQTYTANGSTGASYYTWTVPSGWNITSTPPYTNVITVTVGTATGTITATPYNACGVAGIQQTLVNPTVNTVTTITTQPSSPAAFCAGGNTSFTVAATGTALTYQWYVSTNGGTSYTAVANGGVYSGATTATLTLTAVPATYNGYLYECIVTGTCGAVTSNAATLTVNALPATPTFASQPTPPVCPNTAGQVYTVNNLGLTYTWTVTGTGWGTFTGQGTSSISATSGTATGTISVTGSNGTCSSLPLTTTTTIVATPTQPTSITPATAVCAGSTQTYTANGGTGASYYTWTVPAGWTITSTPPYSNVINVTVGTATGTITATPYNTCGVAGTAQTLVNPTVNPATAITTQPSSPAAFCAGGNTSFTVAATGAALTYQWYVSTNGGTSYTAVTNGGIYAGATTATLTLTAVPATDNGYLYECIVTGSCGAVTSNAATLTVNALPATPTFASQPTPPVCPNTAGQIYTVNNLGLIYTWTVTGTGWGTFTGQGTSSISATSGTGTGTISVTGSNGTCSSLSLTTTTTIVATPTQPTSITPATSVCAGSTQTYTANGGTGASYYTWTVPAGWAITSTPPYSNVITVTVGTATGTITATPYNTCGIAGPAQMLVNPTVTPATTITTQPSSPAAFCAGGNTSFTVAATGAALTYQWYVSTNGGTNYTAVAIGGIYAGATTVTLTLTAVPATDNGYLYRCVVTGTCGAVTSSAATLTVNALPATPTFASQPTPPVCPNSAGQVYSVTNLGLTYTWTVTGTGWGTFTGQGTSIISTTSGTGTGTISVTASNGTCTSAAASTTTTIMAAPTQPSAITPTTPVCANSTQTYSVTNVAGVTYTWAFPAGWVIVSGQGTNSVIVTVGTVTGTITVTASNSCGTNGTAQTLVNPTVNASTLTISTPIPATGYIQAGNSNVTVFGFTLTPNACVSSYSLTGANITTAGTAINTDLSNFQLVYDQNNNGIYDGADVIVSAAALSLPGPLNFTVTGQTGLTGTRNYIVIANVAAGAVPGHTFSGSLANTGLTVVGATTAGTAAGNTQTIEGAVTIAAVQPAAATLLQSSTSNPIAAYTVTVNSGSSYTPSSFAFTTAGTYTSGTDFTNFTLWQSTSSPFSTGTATKVQTGVTVPATGGTVTFSIATGATFTALSLSSVTYFYITADVPATGINGDFINIATDALTNFVFTSTAIVRNGTNPTTVGNAQTIIGPLVTITTQTTPAAGTLSQGTTSNAIASYLMTVANYPVTPTSFAFITGGTYSNATDIIPNLELYENTTNSLLGATLIGSVAAPATGGTAIFNSGFTALAIGNVYFIVAADVGTCAANGKTIYIAAGTANFANFSFTASGGDYVKKTGPVNPAAAGNTQTISAPVVTIATAHPAAGTLSQGSTGNVIASYLMTASNVTVTPSSFTFKTGGTYTPTTDFTNFTLWVNSYNNIGGATAIGSIAVDPASGGTISFTSFPAAATIASGTSSYFLVTADVPLSGVNGDYVNIAADAVTNFTFTSSSGGCVATSPSTGNFAASNNQTISGPIVAISSAQPAAGNIAVASTGNMIAVYELDVTNAASVTPTNLTLTTAGAYLSTDFTDFKVYQNNAVTLSGATYVGTASSAASGGTVTFNSGFAAVPSGVTTYLIIIADVAAGATLGDQVKFTTTALSNFSFVSSTGGGVEVTGTNPAAASNLQTIVGPNVAIVTSHPNAGSMLVGSINNLLAGYKLTVTGASIAPASLTVTTNGTYLGASDITNFYLYQNTSNSLTGATLVGTIAATGTASGQTLTFSSGFSTIAAGTTSYLLLSADISGGATAGDYVYVNSTTASGNFTFSSSATVTGGTLAASNNQTIISKLDVYWSGTNNWDNSTIDWGNTGGPYNTSLWIVDGNAHLEGIAGRMTINAPVVAKTISNPSVNAYTIDAGATGNTITLTTPASITIGTGITYAGDNNNRVIFAGVNGLTKLGAGELQIESPFVSGFTGDFQDDAGTLTFGSKTEGSTKTPYNYLKNANSIYLNDANLTLAADGGADASLQNLTSVVAVDTNTISLYQNNEGGNYFGEWMNVEPTTGTGSFSTTGTPLQVSGQLTVDNGGFFDNTTDDGVSGTFGGTASDQNTICFGNTTLTGNTTFIGYCNQARLATGAGTMININLGGYGNYLVGIGNAGGGVSVGGIADNGYTTTFYGGGGSVYDGAELLFNSSSSTMTGNWVIGKSDGTQAGWVVTNTTTCLTRGTVAVNNYSKLCPQLVSSVNQNVTYAPTTIYLTGLGPAYQDYPAALDLYNFSGTPGITTLPSNIVLNPVDATHRLASIGSMVPGTGLSATTFQLTGVLSGTGGLEKIGPGVLQLNAQNISGFVNSYQDSTRIRQGTLTINYGSNLGTGPLVMYQLSASPTVLNLNNTSQTIASLSSYWTNTNGTYTQTVNINGCTLTDNQSTNTTFGNGTGANLTALIAGTGTFIKSGTGTLTLTGPNTYTGLTQVAGGTLALSRTGGTTLPATNTVDIIGGTLSVNTTQTLKNVTLSTGTLNVATGVTLIITGTFTLVNGNITGGGTIAYTNGTLIYAGSVAQTVNTGNSPVEWPTNNAPTNITFDNYTYTGYTSGGVKLIAGKTILSGGTANVNGWLDFAGNTISGAGAFSLNGLTSYSYTGNVTNGSSYITSVSTINGIYPGMLVTGTGIPSNTYIIYIDTVLKTNTVFLNNNATATGTTVTLKFSARGGVKVSLPTGLDNSGTGHVQVTGTKTYKSGANYVFNTPASGTQIYPGFPTTPTTATYSPAWDVKINVGSGNNMTMMATGVGSTIEVADSLVLGIGVWATNTGLITWDNPGTGYLVEPQLTWAANSTAYLNSFIATCDNSGNPISVSGATSPYTGNQGFKIKSVTNVNTYFPVGASFISAYPTYSSLPSPNRMMINNAYGTPEDFSVIVNYGDVGYSDGTNGAYRVNRIWYIKTSASRDTGQATVQLFFTKRDNSVGNWLWPSAGGENEVEAGFLYTQPALVEKDYSNPNSSNNFIYLSTNPSTDVTDFSSAVTYPNNTEIYGLYSIGVSSRAPINSTKDGIGEFNRFSVVNPGDIVLPVKVIDFRAYQQGSGVQTSWTCLNEMNMNYYEVQRSANATDFTSLGSVNALNNGQPSVNYGFYDKQPLQGDNYYRIRIVGKDGSVSYTNIELVVIGSTAPPDISIYPNPVTQYTFTLQMTNIHAGSYSLVVYNTLGQKILNQPIEHPGGSASQTVYLPAGTARGEYHVRLIGIALEMDKTMTVQ